MSVVDARNFQPQAQQFSRKPLPQPPGGVPGARPTPSANNFQPDQTYLPQHVIQQQPQPLQQQQQQQPQRQSQANPPAALQPDQGSSHSRSRTASSSIFPLMTSSQPPVQQQMPQSSIPVQYQHQQQQQRPNQYAPPSSRRTLSNVTTSTAPTSTYNPGVMRQNSSASSDLQRSTSSNSSISPTSYVALMRKQKATVWSDRTQHEDPRMVAQQRLAKERAVREVTSTAPGSRMSTSGSSSSITGGVRSKIRAPKAQQYAPGVLPASGVPVRLSQNEIDEDDSDDGSSPGMPLHRRTDSGRSSFGSAGQAGIPPGSQAAGAAQYSGGQSIHSPVEHRSPLLGSAEETPVPGRLHGSDYFSQTQVQNAGLQRAGSGGSGSTGRENSFGAVGQLPERTKPVEEKLDPAELRRRGSVDERTMTMSGYGTLFVANPDVDD